ncbi:MAG: guanylate kinase [Desulfomonile sp.]|nr:guanylate kinase [Desulfomonile sp.]
MGNLPTQTADRRRNGRGRLFVVSAPSGAGKSTLLERVRELFPEMLYSVSCTTRAPRTGEIDGVHYHFVSEAEFRRMIQEGRFLEWKEVHGNLYGTPAGPIEEAIASGRSIILDIDVEGAKEVFARMPSAVGIFINAPNLEVLEERLRRRGTDSEDAIRLRMRNAAIEMQSARLFQHRIVNADLVAAVDQLAGIIRQESEISL